MTRKSIVLSSLLIVLVAVYVMFFTDWFRAKTVQIIPQVRGGRPSRIERDANTPAVYPVSFSFNGKYEFTSVKVVTAEDLATNKYAHPLWHLISDSHSVPTKAIVYGKDIGGMKPAVPGAKPDALEPNVPYVLLVEADAGRIKAQTNFITRVAVKAAPR